MHVAGGCWGEPTQGLRYMYVNSVDWNNGMFFLATPLYVYVRVIFPSIIFLYFYTVPCLFYIAQGRQRRGGRGSWSRPTFCAFHLTLDRSNHNVIIAGWRLIVCRMTVACAHSVQCRLSTTECTASRTPHP